MGSKDMMAGAPMSARTITTMVPSSIAPPLSARGYSARPPPLVNQAGYDIYSTGAKPTRQILGEIQRALTFQKVLFKQQGLHNRFMKCQKQTVKFEVEISGLNDDTNVLKFRRTGGDYLQ